MSFNPSFVVVAVDILNKISDYFYDLFMLIQIYSKILIHEWKVQLQNVCTVK